MSRILPSLGPDYSALLILAFLLFNILPAITLAESDGSTASPETRALLEDDYTVAPGHKSLVVALGCFWCAEQAFEQYAPGVVEAVSGYAGGTNDNPTYRNHPGHYEVILIEYDPAKTSYELLVRYAYRNLDPFDAIGQFCDKGYSYRPAIFYQTKDERIAAKKVLAEIIAMYPDWNPDDIVVPILERPRFWTAEEYHQNYYIKNPKNYGYYKNACGRTRRLKQVWGEEQYYCYHDLDSKCFNITADLVDDENEEAILDLLGEEAYNCLQDSDSNCFNMTIVNEDGMVVEAEVNLKNAPEETAGLMPTWAVIVVSIAGFVVALVLIVVACKCCRSGGKDTKK